MRRSTLLLFVLGALAIVLVAWMALRNPQARRLRMPFADGRVFHVEAVTYGTNHAVGHNEGWLAPVRGVLPAWINQRLVIWRGRSEVTSEEPALVVWLYARDGQSGKFVDCQGLRAALIDEHGDVYPATRSGWHGLGYGFNRQAWTFLVFPRRSATLELQLGSWRSEEHHSVAFRNPAPPPPAPAWTPESLPAVRRVGDLEFTLESLVIRTNGGKERYWEPVSRHWEPGVRLTANGSAAEQWEPLAWQAEDPTGHRVWLTPGEPGGERGVLPFLLVDPPGTNGVALEVILRQPVQAEFVVPTGS